MTAPVGIFNYLAPSDILLIRAAAQQCLIDGLVCHQQYGFAGRSIIRVGADNAAQILGECAHAQQFQSGKIRRETVANFRRR